MDFPRMQPLTWRRLTPGERSLAHEVFGEALDVSPLRLFALPLWNRPFVPGRRLVVWPAPIAPMDFTSPGVPLSLKAVLVHELTHVWQAQRGVNLPLAKLKVGDKACIYDYDLAACGDFSTLNIEQQAMVVQHAFLAGRGGRAPYESQAYAAILTTWTKGEGQSPRKV